MSAQHTPGPWKRVAWRMWVDAGRPEYAGVGSAWLPLYEDQAKAVLTTLGALGYEVKKRAPHAKATGSAS